VSDVFVFILCVLAVYRVAHMTSSEIGPFAIFAKIREFVIKKCDGKESDKVWWIVDGFHCILCQSVWFSLLATLLFFKGVGVENFILIWMAIAGGGLVLHQFERE